MSRRRATLMRSRITGTGSYLPAKVLTNRDLESMVETTDEWIVARTGIRERHIAADGRDDERPRARTPAATRWRRPGCAPATSTSSCSPPRRRTWCSRPAPACCRRSSASGTAPPSTCRRCARASSTRSPPPTTSSASGHVPAARSWSAPRSSRASSTGRTAAPACSSATAPGAVVLEASDEPGILSSAPARRRRLRRHPQHARPRVRRRGPGRSHAQDGRRRGVQARRARARGERARGARGQRPGGRRHRLATSRTRPTCASSPTRRRSWASRSRSAS